MMNRTKCLEALAARLTDDEIVVATYSTASEWVEMSDRALNYYSFGAMGLASSHGIGLALARPERRVVVLDGDGSLLMNLGTLVTIANVAPENLTHFVGYNGCYEANGEHPIPGRDAISFAGFARSAGYKTVTEFRDVPTMAQELPAFMEAPGPRFATLFVQPSIKPELDYALVHGEAARKRFAAGLAEDRARLAASR
jgi:phosphonopyruvate decarboxylase